MADKIQAIRGMHDALPDSTPVWQHLEKVIKSTLSQYGYQEIRLPVVEKTELFERSIGTETDIVSKEMYTFEDRSGDRLTLRPEGTAGCVRAYLENGLLQSSSAQRLWYIGPMFRHERPQKGRTRQFHQIGVESFGLSGPDIDAEHIVLCARIWRKLGLHDLTLELNTLGSSESRSNYRQILVDYFQSHINSLDEDSRTRLEKNPLRILDSKNPDMQKLIAAAPIITEYLDTESAEHFQQLQELLNAAGISYVLNPRLVRGLDYYNKTVFEWITDQLGAQGAVCSGGRYDRLVEQSGGKSVPATGFAMGLERLIALLEQNTGQNSVTSPHIYFIIPSGGVLPAAIKLSEELRNKIPALRLSMHCGGGSFKSQFKKADKSGAQLALVLGDDEQQRQTISIKPLRTEDEQLETSWDNLAATLEKMLGL